MSFDIEDGPPGPRNGDSRSGQTPTIAQQPPDHHIRSYDQDSKQVAWWEVHLWRDRMLEQLGVESFPTVGSPAWCALDDTHPAKLAAVLDASQHWALRLDTAQEAHAAASRAISAALDWTAVGRENQQRADFYADRPYLRRVVVA